MTALTLYAVLGVPPVASPAEVASRYRELTRQHHPDAGGDEEKFKRITEAGSILKDEQRRLQYDKELMMTLDACHDCKGEGVYFTFSTKRGPRRADCRTCDGVGYFERKRR